MLAMIAGMTAAAILMPLGVKMLSSAFFHPDAAASRDAVAGILEITFMRPPEKGLIYE